MVSLMSRVCLSVTLALFCTGLGGVWGKQVFPRLADANGVVHSSDEWAAAKAVVFLFLGTECPISNRYSPEINRIVGDYGTLGVVFYAVYADPSVTPDDVRRHGKDFGYGFPGLLDPRQELAHLTGAEVTPTAVVLTPDRKVAYVGRIDNRYVSFGKFRPDPTRRDLRLAVDAVLSGKPVAVSRTKAIGCFLPPLPK